MPSWMPEANATRPSDDEMRSAAKYLQILFDANPAVASPFPEGNRPAPGDDLERLWKKINLLESA